VRTVSESRSNPLTTTILPSGWTPVVLDEIVVEIRPGFASGEHNMERAGIPHLRPMNVDRRGRIDLEEVKFVDPNRGDLRLSIGDVLFNNTNSPELVGKTASFGVDGDFAFSNHMTRIRPAESIDPRFLAHQLHFLWMTGYFRHTCINHVNQASVPKDVLSRLDVLLPPEAEQRRIVAKIEEAFSDLDAGVAALERARKNLERYRASVLKAAVEGRLTEQWRRENPPREAASELLRRILVERRRKWEEEQLAKYREKGQAPPKGWQDRYQEPAPPDTSNLPELPEGWCWASIGQCFTVAVGATPSRQEPSYWNGTIPWVSSGEVQFCRITNTRETITEAGLANGSTKINPAGSVMLGMIGEGRTRGQAAILDIDAANNQNCAAIRVSETPVRPELVYYWLCSQYEVTRGRGSGNNQPALNKSRVEVIPFPLPPVDEQVEIVRILEAKLSMVDRLAVDSLASTARASRLRQSILKRAFEGKLVSQDPTDEPASVLLERIKAEREMATKNHRKRA